MGSESEEGRSEGGSNSLKVLQLGLAFRPPASGVSQLRWRADQHPQKRFKYLVLLLQGEPGTLLLVPAQTAVEARAARVAGQRVSVGLREPRVVGVAEEVLQASGKLLHPARFFFDWRFMSTGVYCSQPHVGEEDAGGTRER